MAIQFECETSGEFVRSAFVASVNVDDRAMVVTPTVSAAAVDKDILDTPDNAGDPVNDTMLLLGRTLRVLVTPSMVNVPAREETLAMERAPFVTGVLPRLTLPRISGDLETDVADEKGVDMAAADGLVVTCAVVEVVNALDNAAMAWLLLCVEASCRLTLPPTTVLLLEMICEEATWRFPNPGMEDGGLMRFSFCRRLQNHTRTTSFSICKPSPNMATSSDVGFGF